jgi:alpha-1,2-mannosyltransferase
MMSNSKFYSSMPLRILAKNALIAFFFFLILAINWFFIQSATKYLLDFGSFMASGIAAVNGQNPYSTNSPLILVVFFKWIGGSFSAPNLNPPITVLLFEGISRFDPFIALATWRILSATGYILSLLVLARVYRHSSTLFRITWAICLAGFWHTIQLGQIYIPLLMLVVAFWVLSESKHLKLAGIALGILISIKPNFIYWAILVGIGGYWSAFFVAACTALLISIVPLLIYGPTIYMQWLTTLHGSPEAGLLLPGNSSLQSLSLHFSGHGWPGVVLSIILALAGVYIAFRSRSDIRIINSLGIILSLLVSPIAWTGYTIFALPIFLAKDRWSTTDKISATLFLIPIWVVLGIASISQMTFHVFGWVYGWGLLFLLAGVFIDYTKPGTI